MTVIRPKWKCPPVVRALITTRQTGNLATHVGDAAQALENRAQMTKAYSLPRDPIWLEQVHGNEVFIANEGPAPESPPVADAAFTTEYNRPLAVVVADCLPVLLASPDEVAVVHAGWKGLARGVIGRAVAKFRNREITAFLGPSIGRCHYEVDEAVKSSFDGVVGFSAGSDDGHYMMDLPAIARAQLADAGVYQVEASGICTQCDAQFFSHRRNAEQARFAAIIWRDGGIF